MTKTPVTVSLTLSVLAALTAIAAPAARADLKVVETLRIDSPQLKAYMDSMTPEQRAKMGRSGNPLLSGAAQVTTLYLRGSKSRADVGPMTYISDAATNQTTMINRRSHTYSTMPTPAGAGGAGQITAKVKDSGQTKVIQGHPARRYMMSATMASQPGTVIQGDIWAAQDLPRPSLPTTGQGGPFAVFQNLLSKVKGFPLKTTLAVTGSPLGSTTVTTSVVSVSKATLPASDFAVPAGYAKSAGGMGGGQ